jgi:DNA-binding transcriptional MerR regulator
MDDMRTELLRWASEVEGRSTADWENLPDIGLYMDQVVTYVERQLAAVWRMEREKPLTPAMVNNYANGQLLPRAEQKKYSREHLAMLLILCVLKPVMPIGDIARLLSGYPQGTDTGGFYRTFRETQSRAMSETAETLRAAMDSVPDEAVQETGLRRLALELAVEAQARSLAAERILSLLADSSRREAQAAASRDGGKEPPKEKGKEGGK